MIGKYHLGDIETPLAGFDHWVAMDAGHVHSFCECHGIENGKRLRHKGSTVDFFTEKATDYIGACAKEEAPFFLYLPYPAPYGHWPSTAEETRNRHSAHYDDCEMRSIPRRGLSKGAVNGFLVRNQYSGAKMDYSIILRSANDLPTLRNYFAQVSMIDEGVGTILQTLEDNGISENTMVIFTADHGLSMGHHGFWGHGSSTYPSNMHRAANSVPLIVRYGARASGGQRNTCMVSNMDLFSTVLEACEVSNDHEEQAIPSESLMPLLAGQTDAWKTNAVFSEQEETRVVRTGKWVYFKRFDKSEDPLMVNELFDVETDPEEGTNLAGQPEFAEIEGELSALIDSYFEKYSRKEANLWEGGHPIQNSERWELWRSVWGDNWGAVHSYD